MRVMRHTLVATVVVLCALFTFIDAAEYTAKRSTEFYDLVSNPMSYFKDNKTYYREIKERGLPEDKKARIMNALTDLDITNDLFATKISSSNKKKGER